MPVLMFTVHEVASAFNARIRELADEVAELSDVGKKPLNPGESPGDRYHQLAKLGKRLSEACIEYDDWMKALVHRQQEAAAPAGEPAEPPASDRSN